MINNPIWQGPAIFARVFVMWAALATLGSSSSEASAGEIAIGERPREAMRTSLRTVAQPWPGPAIGPGYAGRRENFATGESEPLITGSHTAIRFKHIWNSTSTHQDFGIRHDLTNGEFSYLVLRTGASDWPSRDVTASVECKIAGSDTVISRPLAKISEAGSVQPIGLALTMHLKDACWIEGNCSIITETNPKMRWRCVSDSSGNPLDFNGGPVGVNHIGYDHDGNRLTITPENLV